jgi:hypothetical protein
VKKKFLGDISTFLKFLSPIRKKRLKKFEKPVLQKCLGIAFYTYVHVNLCPVTRVPVQDVKVWYLGGMGGSSKR